MAEETQQPRFAALVNYEDDYVQPLILKAFTQRLPSKNYNFFKGAEEVPSAESTLLQFLAYESIDFDRALSYPKTNLINAYIIRKALIRKHYLSNTISSWVVKHPSSCLKNHFKPAVDFELDYAEFLDDALVEAFELRESFEQNEGKDPSEREWWILKPGMSDRGQGIRLFSTEEELQGTFEEWEADAPESDDENYEANARSQTSLNEDLPIIGLGKIEKSEAKDYIITSHLRHFIAQPYIDPPLLLPSSGNRKFHIRTYVLSVGALKVYVYKPMLALFAAEPYAPPWKTENPTAHLTNTCLQDGSREGSVRAFWDLEGDVQLLTTGGDGESWKDEVFKQICDITGELFEAAARGQMVHFQPLPNAFELFGLDFLVDAQGVAWLLEVNAFPDFKQSGDDLSSLIGGLFDEVVDLAIGPFFGMQCAGGTDDNGVGGTVKVLDIDLGRK